MDPRDETNWPSPGSASAAGTPPGDDPSSTSIVALAGSFGSPASRRSGSHTAGPVPILPKPALAAIAPAPEGGAAVLTHGRESEHHVTPEEEEAFSQNAPTLGPCSRVWEVPKRTRKKRQTKKPSSGNGRGKKRKTESDDHEQQQQTPPRRRRPFQDEETRIRTAMTRELTACIRCRMQRIRCEIDMSNPNGPCITCQRLTSPVLCHLPCLRWIMTDSSLYREQSMPYQFHSRRWQSMDLVDIQDWASAEIKTVVISQMYLDAPYPVRVREFVPVEGDRLEESYTSNGVVKKHPHPRFALVDMKETAQTLQDFIDFSVGTYIGGTVGESDEFIWSTYWFAFAQIQRAKTKTEKDLLTNTFRFWMACRMTSHPHHIYGEEKLGGHPVNDPASNYHNKVPMPNIIVAQKECIMYSRVLRPMQKKLLHDLTELVNENKPKYWLTIYLTMFILLHSCSMITRRDWETARLYDSSTTYANPESIAKHHFGANTLLAHFHYLNKGVHPFQMTSTQSGIEQLSKAALLDANEIAFVKSTCALLNEPERARLLKVARDKVLVEHDYTGFNHDLYWVSQLYDSEWKPGPTA